MASSLTRPAKAAPPDQAASPKFSHSSSPCTGRCVTGRPVAFAVTPGNIPDIDMAVPLLEGLSRPKRLIADKAYDAMSLRRWLKRRRIKAVIPSLATRTFPFPLDRKAYKRRNVVERMWGRLKNWRRIATRYDRLARNYLASLALVSIVIAWA
ncbi:IS5 family transposase [Paracoccus benzoatiresistens]|uniref:IS5 family transposase n=1 Tax=Paracoccus benzoatiresistens TaxID=2997341 RepID=A0ABT4J9V1_9RHOB|nr:IS5 family transposase [Paracoccus sp. EF6]MCZ0963113.1 IS5 family transposase [Paracoccus sp. EF6]